LSKISDLKSNSGLFDVKRLKNLELRQPGAVGPMRLMHSMRAMASFAVIAPNVHEHSRHGSKAPIVFIGEKALKVKHDEPSCFHPDSIFGRMKSPSVSKEFINEEVLSKKEYNASSKNNVAKV
jgi:hypothetical protein